jgi:cytoskeleton protein RodZ
MFMPMPSIGETLREARSKKGVSLEIAARTLKMKVERLKEIEENRYDGFAAHVYVRSFVRHYAEYLGLDGAAIVQQFNQDNPQPKSKPIFEITEEQRAHSPLQRHVPVSSTGDSLTATGKTVLVAVLVIFFLAIASTWWATRAGQTAAAHEVAVSQEEVAPSATSSNADLVVAQPIPASSAPTPTNAAPPSVPPAPLHR